MAAEKGATLPTCLKTTCPSTAPPACRRASRASRVRIMSHPCPCIAAPPRGPVVAARRAAAPLLLAAARTARGPRQRRGFHALLAAALAKRPGAAGAAAGHDGRGRAVEAARAEDRAALAAAAKLAALRTVPVQRLFERRVLRTRRSSSPPGARPPPRRSERPTGSGAASAIICRNVSRWRRGAMRRALDDGDGASRRAVRA